MSKQEKNCKNLSVGVLAIVVLLSALLVVVLSACTGTGTAPTTEPSVSFDVVEKAELYWNIDRALYDGKSEAGMSSRKIGSDGYYHIRFFKDGKTIELRATDKAMVNNIEVRDLMGIVTDEEGVITDVVPLEQMPVEKVGWKFYVQSVGGNVVKLNSSDKFNGMELVLKLEDGAKVYDMTGTAGEPGTEAQAAINDRVMCVSDENGKLLGIYIYDRSNMQITFDAECQHCKQEVEWIVWKDAKKAPTQGGHFQLANDIQLSGQQSMAADAKICLDLNGHRIDGKDGSRVYSVHNLNCELAIMDTSEGQTGVIAPHGKSDGQGLGIWVRHGAVYFYGGTIDASDASTTNVGGTGVYVAAGRFFYMYGGQIIGGTSLPKKNANGSYTNGLGASVYIKGGKFVMHDGVIRDGHAKSVKTVKDGKVTYQRGLGGNIFMTGGTLEIHGGVIKDGKAGAGGNVFADGAAEVTITGGKITGGETTDVGRNGGNLYINTKAVATISGGRIDYGATKGTGGNVVIIGKLKMIAGSITYGALLDSDGKVKENPTSANVYVGNGGYFKFYGGVIDGSVGAIDTSNTDGKHTVVSLTKNARINSRAFAHPGLTLMTGKEKVIVEVENMGKNASIGVNASGIFSLETDEKNLSAFYSDVEGVDVVYTQGCLALGKMACLCGSENHFGKCDGTELLWGPWTSKTSLPSTEGNYFLQTDVDISSTQTIGSKAEQKINLNLNGHTVTGDGRTAQVRAVTSIVDHVGGGVICGKGPGNKLDHSGVFQVFSGGVDLYGGTLKLADDHNPMTNAGVLSVAAGAEVNVYGGTIDARNSGTAAIDEGGAIRLSGVMNVYAGNIYGTDTTNNGGTICVWKGGCLNVYGGTITGAKTGVGGTIYLNEKSEANIAGGTITGGTAKNVGNLSDKGKGGNIYVANNAVLNISGGTVMGGTAVSNGGNIAVLDGGKLSMSGGMVKGGRSSSSLSTSSANANFYLRNCTVDLSGGEIAGYVTVMSNGGKTMTLNLSGNPVIKSGSINLRLYGASVAEQPKIDIDGALTGEPGSIGITMQHKPGVFATDAEASEMAVFFSDDANYNVTIDGDELRMETPKCLCGADSGAKDDSIAHKAWCDGTMLNWKSWDGTSALTEGNWYLTGDVTASAVTAEGKVNLDLAGKKLSGELAVTGDVKLVNNTTGGELAAAVTSTGKLGVFGVNATGAIAVNGGEFTVGGDAKLADVTLAAGQKVAMLGLGESAEVILTMAEPGVFAEGVTSDISASFKAKSAEYEILFKETEQQLEYAKKKAHSHCWCINADVIPEGHVCEDSQVWTPIEKSGNSFTAEDGGHYYLNWSLADQIAKGIKIPDNATVYLCINGAHIRASNVIQLGVNSKVIICDCKDSGIITTTQNSPIVVKDGQEVTFMSGIIAGTYANTASRVSVLVQGGTFNQYGGSVERGCEKHKNVASTSKKEAEGTIGGNIRIESGAANLFGGSVTKGKLLDGTDRDITVLGGTLTVGGKAEIGVLYLPEGKTISVVEKDLETNIGISMEKPGEAIAVTNNAEIASSFTSLNTEYPEFAIVNGNLVMIAPLAEGGHYHCFCENAEALPEGHKCTTIQQWTAAAKNSTKLVLADGDHYYLNWTGSQAKAVEVSANAEAYLCLNGATIYAGSPITLGKGATLHICDCSTGETGTITRSGSSKRALIEMDSGTKTFYFYSGTINGTHDGKSIRCVEMCGGTGTFYMYGGRITGGNGDSLNTTNAATTEKKKSSVSGGNILMAGGTQKFYFYGGKIDGGTVNGNDAGGSNLFIGGANCKFYLNGGTMESGTINGTNSRGGNILMVKGEFILNSGVIKGGTVSGKGGTVALIPTAKNSTPKFVMNGGIIEGGSAANGGTVCLNALEYEGTTATFEMNGGTIKGGVATVNGGTIYIDSARDTLTVNGGTIETGTAAVGACIYNKAGNVTVAPGATVGQITTP